MMLNWVTHWVYDVFFAFFPPRWNAWLVEDSPTVYFRKWKGKELARRLPAAFPSICFQCFGFFWSLFILFVLGGAIFQSTAVDLSSATFVASAFLVFCTPEAPSAQPYNIVIGNVVGAFVGVGAWKLFEIFPVQQIAYAAAPTFAMFLMELLAAPHAPGCAVASIAAISRREWEFVLVILLGNFIIIGVGVVLKNVEVERRYPISWI